MGKRVTAILQDHDAMLARLAQRALSGDEAGDHARREFVRRLGTHILAVDTIVKPVLQHCDVADRLKDWLDATATLQSKVALALTLDWDSTSAEAALYEIAAHWRYLREQEAERLAQILTECLSDGELRLLGADLRLLLDGGEAADSLAEEAGTRRR